MKKKLLLSLMLGMSGLSYGQNGQLPPVTFPSGSNVCDPNSWKLVFQDYFNGDQLNPVWRTYTTWASMAIENDNWPDARVMPQIGIAKDENVFVSNGTCKLVAKREYTSWQCDTCPTSPHTSNYSGGELNLPYSLSFDAGKFEASISYPTFKYAHGTFWTWWGGPLISGNPDSRGVDEIDISEAYGVSGWPPWPMFGYAPTCNYSLHAWEPGITTSTNPYNMSHVEVANRFPRQNWYNWLFGNYFDQTKFHTYTCEWDTALIRIYLDGNLQSEFWKYYQTRTYKKWWNPFKTYSYQVGSGCNPTGTWNVMQGFPYNNKSGSNLRFTLDVDKEDNSHSGTLGQMEIDYVKIWQRQFNSHWHDLCDPTYSTITGPDVICDNNTYTYNANPPSPSGYWLTPTSNLTVLSSNNASITVKKNPSAAGQEAQVYYYPLDPTCPQAHQYFLVWKRLYAGKPDNVNAIVTETHYSNHTMHYNLRGDYGYTALPNAQYNYSMPVTYEWDIYYGPNYSQHQHVFGQTVSTPNIAYTSGTTTQMKWTLKATNSCGTVIKNGQMDFYMLRKAPTDASDKDPNNIYAVADITDDEAYEHAVDAKLAQTFIPENADDVTISSVIEEVEMNELTPYILIDSDGTDRINTARKIANFSFASSETKIYPNPASTYVNIGLNENYVSDVPVKITLIDLMGKTVREKQITYKSGDLISLDIFGLAAGIYNVKIVQGDRIEYLKVMKQLQ